MKRIETLSPQEINARNIRQTSVYERVRQIFGEKDLAEVGAETRLLRFVENALELALASGMTADRASAVLDEVFSRSVGDLHTELGQTMVALQAFATSAGVSLAEAEDAAVIRANETDPEVLLASQAEKRAKGL